MFALPLLDASLKIRTGGAQWLAEGVAAFGLVATILAGIRFNRPAIPWLVGFTSRGLLVHLVDILCQSGRRYRALADQYVSGIRPPIFPAYRRRTLWRDRRDAIDGLAAARGRRGGCHTQGGRS